MFIINIKLNIEKKMRYSQFSYALFTYWLYDKEFQQTHAIKSFEICNGIKLS